MNNADATTSTVILAAVVALMLATCVGILTAPVRSYALRAGLVEAPGIRSSHVQPTPIGGGLAFVVPITVAWFMTAILSDDTAMLTIACSGLALACIGFEDDRRRLSPILRLGAHCVAAAAVCFTAMSLPDVSAGDAAVVRVLAVLAIAWSSNLFNFMDGLDGLATSESLFVVLGGLAVAILTGAGSATIVAMAALAGGLGGFLPWNAPKARIFMGDAGSTWLGFVLASLALLEAGRCHRLPMPARPSRRECHQGAPRPRVPEPVPHPWIACQGRGHLRTREPLSRAGCMGMHQVPGHGMVGDRRDLRGAGGDRRGCSIGRPRRR
jgi:UDP-N-acetylmuramyl pentapeptide phosphotransferase/UDP-N-acetylglucosamine-1-phosphate transferase